MKSVLAIDPGYHGFRVGIYCGVPDPELAVTNTVVKSLSAGENPFETFWELTGTIPSIVVIPGGSYRPSRAGCYWLSGDMANEASYIDFFHPRNQTTIMAYRYCLEKEIPGLVVEPMNTADLVDEATFSGVKDYWRRGVFYALPQRVAFQLAAERAGKRVKNFAGITVYLGEETCVSAHRGTKVIDTSDPIMGEGPFGLRSAGTLPATAFVDFMARGGLGERPVRRLKEESGLLAYLKRTSLDLSELEKAFQDGQDDVVNAVNSMAYQVAKEIGRQLVSLQGQADSIILCGEGAGLEPLVLGIKSRVSKWAEVCVFSQDLVIPSLVKEGINALNGKRIKKYTLGRRLN